MINKLLIFRVRGARDIIFLIFFGISIGYLLGLVYTYDVDNNILQHIHITKHEEYSTADSIFLRCVVIIHQDTVKPEKILSALKDGYTKLCNDTVYFTNKMNIVKKFGEKYPINYVDIGGSHFHWSFYQYVMEFSSKTPAQWTFIGDDQTYLVVQNLKKVLSEFNAEENIILGKLKDSRSFSSYLFPFSSTEMVAIRAGVVFSNPAIDRLSECRGFLLPRSSDSSLFQCSKDHNIRLIDPFDEDSLRLFNDQSPERIIFPHTMSSYFFPKTQKKGKISDHAISFGQLSVKQMRVLEFGMGLKVFGRGGVVRED